LWWGPSVDRLCTPLDTNCTELCQEKCPASSASGLRKPQAAWYLQLSYWSCGTGDAADSKNVSDRKQPQCHHCAIIRLGPSSFVRVWGRLGDCCKIDASGTPGSNSLGRFVRGLVSFDPDMFLGGTASSPVPLLLFNIKDEPNGRSHGPNHLKPASTRPSTRGRYNRPTPTFIDRRRPTCHRS
jgi:hypothetical protein